jgi:prepilin-type N-terminal cleavage/methylation domain-containing protein
MINNKKNIKGFTLVELLMVVAIIGLLASILSPNILIVLKKATIAKGKAQLYQYVNAIIQFEGQYGYYPFARGDGDYVIKLSDPEISKEFIETMSGRDAKTGKPKSVGGNRRQISFHDFAEKEFYIGSNDRPIHTQLADGFNNVNICIMIDGDGDGFLKPRPSLSSPKRLKQAIRGKITAWVESDNLKLYPSYTLWEQ